MVEHSGVGIQIKPHQVTSQTIKESIETIESGGYHDTRSCQVQMGTILQY